MSISTGVVVAVAFEQVDSAPDTETGTESDDERLQYADCTVEKCHKVFPPLFAPQVADDNEKALFLQRMCTYAEGKGHEKSQGLIACQFLAM